MVALGLSMSLQPSATLPPPQSAAASTARALAKAVETSSRLAVLPKREFGDPRVPDILQPHLLEAELDRTLHRQIGDFVEAWLREHGAAAPTDQIEEELRLDLLWGVIVPKQDEPGGLLRVPFEGDVKFAVARPADDPELLAVSWKTELAYLGNSSVYVFTTGGGRVERVLEWSAELAGWPEGDSSGTLPVPFGPTDVLHDFDFSLGARDERGDFHVAAAWSEPSPASSWGTISWVVLANGPGPRSPRVLARGSDSAWQCFEDCYRLALEGDLIMLDYTASAGGLAICNGYTTSDVQRQWRLVDGGVEESSLPGPEPVSFLSDWIADAWSDARQWSTRGWYMRRWHRLLGEVGCELERGRQWVDACEATRREVLELVLVSGAGESDSEQEQPLPLFFLFDAGPPMRLLDITPRLPAGDWQDLFGCEAVPSEPADDR